MSDSSRSSRLRAGCGLLLALGAIVGAGLFVHVPDRPVPTIEPGSSDGPAFVVQVIRPRAGLPLGGIAPPGWFGVDERLVVDSAGEDAGVGEVSAARIELRADDWELVLARDGEGRVTPETSLVFELVFEERTRRVRCAPGEPVVGSLTTTTLEGTGELSGAFDLELPRCVDAATGEPLGWPPKPLVLHGSFDRLPLAP